MSYNRVDEVDYMAEAEEGEMMDFEEMDEDNHGRGGGEMGPDDYDVVCFQFLL